MKVKIISITVMILLITSCSIPGRSTNVMIDWVDFIVLNDIVYLGNYHGSNKLLDENIKGIIGEVKFNVSSNIKKTDYKIKNGDSAYLPKGTKICKIKEYKSDYRIAVKAEGEWRIYEADTNPGATKGEDLLDISGKILYIGINSEKDGITELGSIKESDNINKLVNMVLQADVNQNNQEHRGQRYFIAFHLIDGTNTTRSYWLNSGELSRGIMLPDEFAVEIKKALIK